MGKKSGVWVLVVLVSFLSLASLALAQETYEIEISVNAINIDGYNSRFFIYDFNAQNITEGNQVVGKNNVLKFSLYQGFYEIAIGVDAPATPGFDYYGKISINVDSNKSAELDAVLIGSRKIEILDMNNNPLHDIPVRIDCNSLSGEQKYFRTDEFGIAEASFLPIGECIFRAAVGNFVISQEDTIDKGSTKNIVMKFDKYSKESSDNFWVIAILVIIIAALLLGYYFIFYKKFVNKKATSHNAKQENADSETEVTRTIVTDVTKDNYTKKDNDVKKDIMTALNASERKVVNFILEEQDKHTEKDGSAKDFYLHQAKIVYGAGIPKTTLVRLLQSLEQKKIIEWERSGKIKKVKLTEWFNSK